MKFKDAVKQIGNDLGIDKILKGRYWQKSAWPKFPKIPSNAKWFEKFYGDLCIWKCHIKKCDYNGHYEWLKENYPNFITKIK